MASPPSVTPEGLDAATAAAIQARRDRLLQVAEGRGTRARVAYVCVALVAVCAVVALFAGDRLAVTIQGLDACMLTTFVFIGTQAARKKARRELREMQLPN